MRQHKAYFGNLFIFFLIVNFLIYLSRLIFFCFVTQNCSNLFWQVLSNYQCLYSGYRPVLSCGPSAFASIPRLCVSITLPLLSVSVVDGGDGWQYSCVRVAIAASPFILLVIINGGCWECCKIIWCCCCCWVDVMSAGWMIFCAATTCDGSATDEFDCMTTTETTSSLAHRANCCWAWIKSSLKNNFFATNRERECICVCTIFKEILIFLSYCICTHEYNEWEGRWLFEKAYLSLSLTSRMSITFTPATTRGSAVS